MEETAPYLQNIVKYLQDNLRVRFEELVGDFIKDESGIWWLVNIKAFKLVDEKVIPDISLIVKYGDEGEAEGVKKKKHRQIK